jgi:hypothetical protein
MKDNQKKNNPATGKTGQGNAETRNKKQTTNNPASRDAHKKDGEERRSSEKIARKGSDTTQKNPGADKNNPPVNETENKTNTPWKDPDPTTPEKNKEVYAEPGNENEDDTSINPRTENSQRNTTTQNTRNEEVIEEERQRDTNKSDDVNKMEEGEEQKSDPGTFDPQAGKDTEAFAENKQNKNTGDTNTNDKAF